MNFDLLVQSISDAHRQLQAQAVKALNVGLTLRNWLIRGYISEYELRGEDPAVYREALYPKLSKRLTAAGISNCNTSRLYRCRDFFFCESSHSSSQNTDTSKPNLYDWVPTTQTLHSERLFIPDIGQEHNAIT